MLDLLKDCCNCFLLSLVKNHLNEHKIYYNFWFFIENSFRNLSSLLRNLNCLSLLNSFLFLSRFSVSLKSLDNYFFRWFAYKSLLSRFSVLMNYNMWSSNHVSTSSRFPRFTGSRFFRVQVFQGPGFSGSRFFKAQVFQDPGFSGSKFFRVQVIQGPGFSGSESSVWIQDPGSGSRF